MNNEDFALPTRLMELRLRVSLVLGSQGIPTPQPLGVQRVRIYPALASMRTQRLFPKGDPEFKRWLGEEWVQQEGLF